VAPDQLLQMPPLHTILRGGKRAGAKHVPVTLAARSTAIGTLELFCVAKEGGNRWRLEFNIRDLVKPPTAKEAAAEDGQEGPAAMTDVWPEAQVQEAARLIREVFAGEPGGVSPRSTPQELTRALEAALEAPRHEWPTGLCRRLWEFLSEVADGRRRSPAHLARWSNLVGYCLRPGFGDPLDKFRIEQLWKMMAAPPGPAGRACRKAGPTTGSSGAAWPAASIPRFSDPFTTVCAPCCCRARARAASSRTPTSWPKCGGRRPAWNGWT
jgi:hypothetical protein